GIPGPPRSIRLSAAGQVFLEDARRLLADAGQAAQRARLASRGEAGQLALGYTSSAALHPDVPRLIRAFQASYPRIRLKSQENATRDLLESVAGGALDAAFVRASSRRYPALQSVVLARETMLAALPSDHPLARESTPLPLSRLAGEAFVLYRRADGPGVQDELLDACRRSGFEPRVVADVPRLLSAVMLVAAGTGVTVVPRTLRSLHQDAVIYRELDPASAFTIPLNLVCRAGPADSPVARFAQLAGQDRPPA
ncbi:LysR family transcriptional regulator, partial [Achromobacter sp. Marseille-Q0513]|uniref:LysR substrate-binding domain-containing protein n=1 Tax=Achromobacter sp. Marseille-Q0513 TaxID=2829161 RepID=UPI001B921442